MTAVGVSESTRLLKDRLDCWRIDSKELESVNIKWNGHTIESIVLHRVGFFDRVICAVICRLFFFFWSSHLCWQSSRTWRKSSRFLSQSSRFWRRTQHIFWIDNSLKQTAKYTIFRILAAILQGGGIANVHVDPLLAPYQHYWQLDSLVGHVCYSDVCHTTAILDAAHGNVQQPAVTISSLYKLAVHRAIFLPYVTSSG